MKRFLPGKLLAMAQHSRVKSTSPSPAPRLDTTGQLFDKMRDALAAEQPARPASMSPGLGGPTTLAATAGSVAATSRGWGKVKDTVDSVLERMPFMKVCVFWGGGGRGQRVLSRISPMY